ncbi:hypothetical protein BJF93_16450 [Xaviernesmea oryzae]|uniref:L,D-TPase catalytic domain-containing protein n=1 Tax=Xaviernesmea oryzae TaxID=464029 RepID=A0A1Q9AST0_9HYPH|nr:L,D-transpeptidase family protein [Xaviernesmea oryzae]OLP58463.1 hypothetical protein BJF93_16450 [Xaviernesmea oryzae]SEM22592.1 Lipoprotein-anchoring transpeptidase ErfK/SrfK [Xaviernesmea oryzae]
MVLRHVLRSGFVTALVLLSTTALAADAKPPLQIVVSRDSQSLTVYDGDKVVATSRVSTGKRGHATPTGIFSILEKRRYHESNIYSDAPMPFMQRLTWSGIALHGSGHVPRTPASHGCVRLPSQFARDLFAMTRGGLHVIIADDAPVPQRVDNPALFHPPVALLSDVPLRPAVSQASAAMQGPSLPDTPEGQTVKLAMSDAAPAAAAMTPDPQPLPPAPPAPGSEAPASLSKDQATGSGTAALAATNSPIRILITRRSQRETVMSAQEALNALGYDAGLADGQLGTRTIAAIQAFRTAENLPAPGRSSSGPLSEDILSTLYAKANRTPPPAGHLLVRRDFKPLIEAEIGIRAPEQALGTHFLQYHAADKTEPQAGWTGMSLADNLPKPMLKRLGITDPTPPLSLDAVLDRLEIPEALNTTISALITDGASLSISDRAMSAETGQGTDFVTLTQPG